jgi:hypothetical protein
MSDPADAPPVPPGVASHARVTKTVEELPPTPGVLAHRRTTWGGPRARRVTGVVELLTPWREMGDGDAAAALRSTVVPDAAGFRLVAAGIDHSDDGRRIDYERTFVAEADTLDGSDFADALDTLYTLHTPDFADALGAARPA